MALTINSDNPEASRTLAAIAAICRSHGARWHPQLQVRIQGGQMTIWAPEGVSGPLITLPTALLVPINGARWSRSGTRLELQAAPSQLTRVQSELLLLQIAVYNATGKLRWWSERHPARLLDQHPDLAEAVAQLKPGYGSPRKERQEGRCSAEWFLDTRSYSHQPEANSAQTTGQTINVLLPLIDLLNHHHQRAGLRIQCQTMVIESVQPWDGGECFANYGNRRDALDLAIHYGFADTSTPFAHSAHLDLNVDGLGRLRVKRQLFGHPEHPLDPPLVNQSESELTISHLCCDRSQPQPAAAATGSTGPGDTGRTAAPWPTPQTDCPAQPDGDRRHCPSQLGVAGAPDRHSITTPAQPSPGCDSVGRRPAPGIRNGSRARCLSS